jgi:small subunit ribosomal protein S6
MQRTYEVMFIVRPDMVEEDLDKLISTLEGQVGAAGGAVKTIERMGKRRLAYVVRKFHEGMYVLFTVESESGTVVHELERRLRVAEPVIKFLTVRVDEEQKRLDKVRKDREAHRRRAPVPITPVVPAPAAPVPVPAPVPEVVTTPAPAADAEPEAVPAPEAEPAPVSPEAEPATTN